MQPGFPCGLAARCRSCALPFNQALLPEGAAAGQALLRLVPLLHQQPAEAAASQSGTMAGQGSEPAAQQGLQWAARAAPAILVLAKQLTDLPPAAPACCNVAAAGFQRVRTACRLACHWALGAAVPAGMTLGGALLPATGANFELCNYGCAIIAVVSAGDPPPTAWAAQPATRGCGAVAQVGMCARPVCLLVLVVYRWAGEIATSTAGCGHVLRAFLALTSFYAACVVGTACCYCTWLQPPGCCSQGTPPSLQLW